MSDLQRLEEAGEKAFQFLSGELKDIVKKEGEKTKFEVVATRGELIENHWCWGNLVFDLDNIKFAKAKIPSLLEHNISKRVGYCTEFSVSSTDGLVVKGNFLSNQFGKEVSEAAADDFPWEISGYFEPGSVETVTEPTTVNGKEIFANASSPLTIFKNITIKEITFCTFGADANTSAKVFNKQIKSNDNLKTQEKDMTELEKANARIAELEGQVASANSERDKFSEENKELKTNSRKSEIESVEKEYSTEFSEEQRNHLMSVDEAGFKFAVSLLSKDAKTVEKDKVDENQKQPNFNPQLFTTQADAGKSVIEGSDDMDNKFSSWSEK